MHRFCPQFVVGLMILAALVCMGAADPTNLPALGTREVLGNVNGLNLELKVQSPAEQTTELQVVCLFEYTEGDITTSPPALPKELNGLVHVDEALNGLITYLRQTGQFSGKSLETLLIDSPSNTLLAPKLLLIGLGNRNIFQADNMRFVGITGMREALRLGVRNYSHASDLKDAGIDSPTAQVAGLVIQGALEAYATQDFLKQKGASAPLTVTKVTLLSGPAFFEDSKTGIQTVLKAIQTNRPPSPAPQANQSSSTQVKRGCQTPSTSTCSQNIPNGRTQIDPSP